MLRTPLEIRGVDLTTVADFEVSKGETIPFVLTYGPSHLALPGSISPATSPAGNGGVLDRVVQQCDL